MNATLSSHGDIADLIGLAGLGVESWDTVVRAMIGSLPGTFGGIHSLDRRTGHCNFNAVAGLPDDAARSYMQHYSTINPWRPLLDRLPTGSLMSTTEMLPVEVFRKTEFVNDWLQPVQRDSIAVGLKLAVRGNDLLNLHIHLPGAWQDPLERRTLSLLQAQIDNLKDAVVMNGLLADHIGKNVAAAALVERSGMIAFVVDKAGRIIDGNGLAEAAFQRQDLVRSQGGLVSFGDPKLQQWFAARAAQLFSRTATGGHHTYLLQEERLWQLTLCMVPAVDPMGANRFVDVHRLLLVLIENIRETADEKAMSQLLRLFNLTAAEVRLAQALGRGLSLSEAAETLSITRETARHRLKVIFGKTGLNRQVDLVVLLNRVQSPRDEDL